MSTGVLFVCTGNIFRSMTAEYAMRAHLDGGAVVSAGTAHRPDLTVRADVAAYLAGKGLDVSAHRRRTVTVEILDAADHVVAMHTSHRNDLRDRFGIDAPLFGALVGQSGDMPDVDDLFAPDQFHSAAAIAHVKATIDRIVAQVPVLARRLRLG